MAPTDRTAFEITFFGVIKLGIYTKFVATAAKFYYHPVTIPMGNYDTKNNNLVS